MEAHTHDLRANVSFRRAAGLACASDTLSITTMEIVDNAFILFVPGAIAGGLADPSSGGASASLS